MSTRAPSTPSSFTRPHDERAIEADGVRFRFLEAGAEHGGTPVVLLHGFRLGAEVWQEFTLPALAGEFHVIAPDLPGFGLSGSLPHYRLPDYQSALNSLLDALDFPQVILLGHSMGAQIAIATAAARPERVSKLILVDSAGLPRTGPSWWVPIGVLADGSMRNARLLVLRARLGRLAVGAREARQMMQHDNVGSYLKQLAMPTLVIWGSRDRILPLEHGALLAKLIPASRLVVMRGAGHMPFYQKPEKFNRLVLAFLRLPPRRLEENGRQNVEQ